VAEQIELAPETALSRKNVDKHEETAAPASVSEKLREAAEDPKAAGKTAARAQTGSSQIQDAMRDFAKVMANGRWSDWIMILVSGAVVLLLLGGLVWLCWLLWLPAVWTWGFERLSWKSVVAPFAIFYLAAGPFISFALFPALISFWSEYGALRQQVKSARDAQLDIEQKLLANEDPNQLVLILSYSREMLSEYYAIAMSQAQRSFRYCLIAMWLGFLILIVGVLDSFAPLKEIITASSMDLTLAEFLTQYPALATALDPNEFVLITGAVIEFIAAIFLWVYRFSIQQQTYYYRRQLKLHNALLAHRLTRDMGQMKDETIKLVIERLLDELDTPTMASPSSAGIGKLLKPKAA
jgi:hypothetical protein